MDCLNDSMALPECKSWVASRFVVIEENGIYKRRCKFNDCTKEYAKGTSHMILKRHWARAHDDIFSLSPRSRVNLGNSSPGSVTPTNLPQTKRNKASPLKVSNSCPNRGAKIAPGRKSNNNDGLTPSSNNKQNCDAPIDVKQVSKRLREAPSIHLTFDIHTPKKGGKTFGLITAFSLTNDSCDVKSVLLEYRHLPYPNDSTTIYEFLRSCIVKFNCREKIISISSNGSDIVSSAIQEFDKRFRLSKNFNYSTIHIKCFPKFIHLNVIDLLRSQEPLIDGIRKIVGFINSNNFTVSSLQQSNTNTSERLAVTTNHDGTVTTSVEMADPEALITGLKLPLDNRNSWNTTFNMIETFSEQRAFIEPALSYFQNMQDLSSHTVDWDGLYDLVQVLKPFHEVIEYFATEGFVSVAAVHAALPHIIQHLTNITCTRNELATAVHNFRIQLELYKDTFTSDLTSLAGLLDPRIKDSFVPSEEKSQLIDMLRKRLESVSPVKKETNDDDFDIDNTIFAGIFFKPNPDEVAGYFEERRQDIRTHFANFWETYKFSYPRLYVVARALACIRANSLPADRMFSAAEHTDRERKAPIDSAHTKELKKSWANFLA